MALNTTREASHDLDVLIYRPDLKGVVAEGEVQMLLPIDMPVDPTKHYDITIKGQMIRQGTTHDFQPYNPLLWIIST